MKCEWKKVKIKDVLSMVVDNRGKTPPTQKNGYRLLEVNAISPTSKFPQYQLVRKFVSQDVYDSKFRKGHPNIGDILVPTVGTLGAVSYVNEPDCCIAQNVVALRTNSKICNGDFLYYILCDKNTRMRLLNLNIGGVQPSIKVPHLLNLDIFIPSLSEQNKISELLSRLDDKIELNNKINANLQQQAQAIFRSWFVDFEPFQEGEFVESELGPIPKGWRVGELSEVATITMGQSPSGKSYNEEGNGSVFFQGRAEFGNRFPTRRLYTTEPKRMAEANSVLMSVRAPVGDINVAYEKCCIGRGLASIQSKFEYSSYMLYQMLSLKRQLDVFNGEGTVFGSINRDTLNAMKVLIPDEDSIEKFECIVAPVDKLVRTNYDEICRLEILRDTLLPKLMSGELSVNEVQ